MRDWSQDSALEGSVKEPVEWSANFRCFGVNFMYKKDDVASKAESSHGNPSIDCSPDNYNAGNLFVRR